MEKITLYEWMQYLGGKHRMAKHISAHLESLRLGNQTYFEPFLGAANIMCRMTGPRIGSDVHPDLIMLLQAVRDGTIDLPDSITEEEFYRVKAMEPCALRAFVGFGCSFGGRWFQGMARSGTRNYCLNAKNSLLKKKPGLQNVELYCCDYRVFDPLGWLIYCDPPYANETKYVSTKKFDHDEFWEVMRKWSRTNTVVVSEYNAPDDFTCVLEMATKTDLRTRANIKEPRVERLWQRLSPAIQQFCPAVLGT